MDEFFAKSIARHTPLPIFFTHAATPIADRAVIAGLAAWAGVPSGARYDPTPFDPQWGLTVDEPYNE